jgi:hypothetical protein
LCYYTTSDRAHHAALSRLAEDTASILAGQFPTVSAAPGVLPVRAPSDPIAAAEAAAPSEPISAQSLTRVPAPSEPNPAIPAAETPAPSEPNPPEAAPPTPVREPSPAPAPVVRSIPPAYEVLAAIRAIHAANPDAYVESIQINALVEKAAMKKSRPPNDP